MDIEFDGHCSLALAGVSIWRFLMSRRFRCYIARRVKCQYLSMVQRASGGLRSQIRGGYGALKSS